MRLGVSLGVCVCVGVVVLEIELRASCMLNKLSTVELHLFCTYVLYICICLCVSITYMCPLCMFMRILCFHMCVFICMSQYVSSVCVHVCFVCVSVLSPMCISLSIC